MRIFEINKNTQNYIAKMYNDGVIPQIENFKTYYIVLEDEPNIIVSHDEYLKNWKHCA